MYRSATRGSRVPVIRLCHGALTTMTSLRCGLPCSSLRVPLADSGDDFGIRKAAAKRVEERRDDEQVAEIVVSQDKDRTRMAGNRRRRGRTARRAPDDAFEDRTSPAHGPRRSPPGAGRGRLASRKGDSAKRSRRVPRRQPGEAISDLRSNQSASRSRQTWNRSMRSAGSYPKSRVQSAYTSIATIGWCAASVSSKSADDVKLRALDVNLDEVNTAWTLRRQIAVQANHLRVVALDPCCRRP